MGQRPDIISAIVDHGKLVSSENSHDQYNDPGANRQARFMGSLKAYAAKTDINPNAGCLRVTAAEGPGDKGSIKVTKAERVPAAVCKADVFGP